MDRDAEARIIADQLVYARQREWSGLFLFNRRKLRDLIAKEMIEHGTVCARDALLRHLEARDADTD